ncbi:MAG: YbaB/EbfC family nucleoid-associated protein [Spirochaetaceae bacterium]|jgi:DNA-binding YbaB/EbfC family protein|nr:YbaB/EbfC family nucleoid-associated protein [Spirochaetaceae bacterium]
MISINPFDILKNAQKIQEQMGAFQEKLGSITATGSAGGGMAEVELNGRMELLALRIAPEAANPKEVEMLQDLIIAAYNNAMEKIKEAIPREISALTGGAVSGLPGFPGLS